MWSHPGQNSGSFYWSNWNSGQWTNPPNMVMGGSDCDGSPIYVGRAYHNGDLIPAKVIPNKRVAYISWGGKEIQIHNCEILCGNQGFQWVSSYNGSVPSNAYKVGNTSSGEPLYCGRVYHSGSQCIGKIHPSHGCLYIPFGGKEHSFKSYEVLVIQQYYEPPPPYYPPQHHNPHHHNPHHHNPHHHNHHHSSHTPFFNLSFGKK